MVIGGVLFRKLLRDLWGRKMSILMIVLIVSVGVGGLVMMSSVYRDLVTARDVYYRERRLADFQIDMKRAPEGAAALAAAAPNVREIYGRVALPALLDLPTQREPISGIAISLPLSRRPILNDVILRSGAWFSGENVKEAILNESFAAANGIRPGDRIKVLLLDEQHEVLVIGTARSPEFVYLIAPDGGLAPDPARFGVIYMEEKFLQRSGDLDGAYNQLLGLAHDNSPRALADTLDLLADKLDAWGVTNSTPAQDMPSVNFLNNELQGIRVQSKIMPTIFLTVALLILNVLMSRTVAQQRTIIGTLKALGRSTSAISAHYLCFGVAIGALGGVGGSLLCAKMQGMLIGIYSQIYTLPGLRANFYPEYHVMGFLVSVAFAALGTVRGVMHAAELQPADAMRPPPPEKGRKIFLERISAFWRRLTFAWRLVLRSIFRNPFRSGVSALTAMVATGLMISQFCLIDALNYIMDYQFNALAHQDVTVMLREPLGRSTLSEMKTVRGISMAEPQLSIACDLVNGAHKKRAAVTGVPPGNALYTPLDKLGHPVVIPREGLVLSKKLAEIMGVGVGDSLMLRPLVARREKTQAPVVAIVETFLGIDAYASISYLSGLIGEEWVANVMLGLESGATQAQSMSDDLKERRPVVGIARRERALTQLQKTFGEAQSIGLRIMIMFAGLIAFGSVLNTAFVTLSEREREVGVFRVMGYTPGEVASILRGELVLLSAVGIFAGYFAGVGLVHIVARAFDTEFFRFPVVMHPGRFVEATALMVGFIAVAQIVVRFYVGKLDWLEAIKIKE